MVLHEGERPGVLQRGAHLWAGFLPAVGEQRLEFEIVRERQALFEVDRAATFVEAVAPLPRRAQPRGDVVRVAHQEGSEVDQTATIRVERRELAAPEHRAAEGLPDGLGLGGVVGQRAEAQVRRFEQHAAADAP